LASLHLSLLKAKEIGIKIGEYIAEPLANNGSQTVNIPRYKFHNSSFFGKFTKPSRNTQPIAQKTIITPAVSSTRQADAVRYVVDTIR
jgi:hypothetical protein